MIFSQEFLQRLLQNFIQEKLYGDPCKYVLTSFLKIYTRIISSKITLGITSEIPPSIHAGISPAIQGSMDSPRDCSRNSIRKFNKDSIRHSSKGPLLNFFWGFFLGPPGKSLRELLQGIFQVTFHGLSQIFFRDSLLPSQIPPGTSSRIHLQISPKINYGIIF